MPTASRQLRPLPDAPYELTPTAWAGGRNIVVPGIGVGVIVSESGPRVVEITLPFPCCAVFAIDDSDEPKWVVLVDPRVDQDRRDRVIACAALFEREGVPVAAIHVPECRCSYCDGQGDPPPPHLELVDVTSSLPVPVPRPTTLVDVDDEELELDAELDALEPAGSWRTSLLDEPPAAAWRYSLRRGVLVASLLVSAALSDVLLVACTAFP
ncbi:MAG TPA: hypothetical protein VM430_18625 [Microbacterium sp.]|nr:hypothetical protein [Microbacterium sp.]